MKLFKSLFIVAVVIAAAAAADAGVSVTPDRHILRLSPGESAIVEYQVHNSGTQDLDIEIDPKDWTNITTDIDSWLSLKSNKLEIKPGETKPMEVTITAPKEKEVEGEILAMLFLCYKEDINSPLNIRNGIPLYVVIKGTERYDAEIKTIELQYHKNDLIVTVGIMNKGNIHIVPDVSVSVKDNKKEELKSFSSKKAKTILRGEQKDCQFTWKNTILPEGGYTVTADLSYEDKLEKAEKTVSFNIADGKLNMLEEKAKD